MLKRCVESWNAIRGDGCTSVPDLTYHMCCEQHDRDYRTHTNEKGERITKAQADKRLYDCMKRAGKTPIIGTQIIPLIYYLGVKIFGGKFWKQYEEPNVCD